MFAYLKKDSQERLGTKRTMAVYQSALGQIGPRSSQADLDEFAPKDSRFDSQFLMSNESENAPNLANLKNSTGGDRSLIMK